MSRYRYQMVCDLNQLLACSQEKGKESGYEVEKGRKGKWDLRSEGRIVRVHSNQLSQRLITWVNRFGKVDEIKTEFCAIDPRRDKTCASIQADTRR